MVQPRGPAHRYRGKAAYVLFGRELSHRQLQRQAQGLAGCSGWPAHSQSGAGKVLWRVLQKRENVQRES